MPKRWFEFLLIGNRAPANGSRRSRPNHALGLMEAGEKGEQANKRLLPSEAGGPPKMATFDQIYENAAVKPPPLAYGILKVMSMADNPHLAGMTPEAKRCALLMALETAGAEIEDLLQDAVVRQRALNGYEEQQQERLREFEAGKTEDNQAIQAELDRITGQYLARIQANADQVARQQDNVRGWQKGKQEECQRIAEAAAFLVPQSGINQNRGLTAVLERAASARR